jgi:hypothetical protein
MEKKMRTIHSIFLFILFTMIFSCNTDNTDESSNNNAGLLFSDDFEKGNGNFNSWFDSSGFITGTGTDDRGRIDISSEYSHSGNYSLYMSASSASDYQGAALFWWACDGEQETNCNLKSYDTLYLRVWIRFAEDHKFVRRFITIEGSQPDDFWCGGVSGCLPNGEKELSVRVESMVNTHESYLTSRFPEMTGDPNCEDYLTDIDTFCQTCNDLGLPTCTGGEKPCYWDNVFYPDPSFALPVGEWFCLDIMVQLNTPGEHDGIMTYWVNNTLIHKVENMMWRTSDTLALNKISLMHSISTSDADSHSNRVWFDDISVSTIPPDFN